jgi:hypothetical protein
MTPQETSIVWGILAGIYTLFQGWLAKRAVDHSKQLKAHDDQLNGMMEARITAGAEKVVAEQAETTAEAKPRRFTPGVR